MGCDIHLYVEKRSAAGQWESADKWENEPEYGSGKRVAYGDAFYNSRNYDLFAILADVRNGHGFAGVKTGEGFNPIDMARGLPDDASDYVRQSAVDWDCDGHSHSYFTVAELLAYDWTQTTVHQGVLDFATYAEWTRWSRKNGDGPHSYSAMVSGPGITIIDEAEADKAVAATPRNVEPPAQPNLYVKARWEQPYYKTVGEFLGETLPRLWRLGKPEDVRIVFWFDN